VARHTLGQAGARREAAAAAAVRPSSIAAEPRAQQPIFVRGFRHMQRKGGLRLSDLQQAARGVGTAAAERLANRQQGGGRLGPPDALVGSTTAGRARAAAGAQRRSRGLSCGQRAHPWRTPSLSPYLQLVTSSLSA
jgi:hypothetical protein